MLEIGLQQIKKIKIEKKSTTGQNQLIFNNYVGGNLMGFNNYQSAEVIKYKEVEELNGYTTIEELIRYCDNSIFFYGESELETENELKKLADDGFKEQAESYNKYQFNNWFVALHG